MDPEIVDPVKGIPSYSDIDSGQDADLFIPVAWLGLLFFAN
jgi:hypothetical protein